MAAINFYIEPINGTTINNPTEEQIMAVLNRFGSGEEACNFIYGDSSVSAYGSAPDKLYLMYIDENQKEFHSEPLSATAVCKVFLDSSTGNTSWKNEIKFSEDQGTQQTYENGTTGTPDENAPEKGGRGKRSLKDELLNAAKSEAGYNIRRIMRRGLRGLFRGRGRRF